jgi:ubiquitin carboxyl-terminal hydrolase L3
MHQTIGNACGTIALLHALGNNQDILTLNTHSFLAQFLTNTQSMNPEERGKYLESPPPGAPTIDSLHEEFASLGQTSAPDADADVNLHFACFVQFDGKLWELDGRYAGPIDHGESNDGNLLRDAVKVVRRDFMDQAEGDINFTLMAFAPKQEDD